MRYRTFPGTTLSVSELGFGTWTLSTGWWGDKTDAEAVVMSCSRPYWSTAFVVAGGF
jgi:aryl-alcohol dehydrogenase-like predicted oxidoreductase